MLPTAVLHDEDEVDNPNRLAIDELRRIAGTMSPRKLLPGNSMMMYSTGPSGTLDTS